MPSCKCSRPAASLAASHSPKSSSKKSKSVRSPKRAASAKLDSLVSMTPSLRSSPHLAMSLASPGGSFVPLSPMTR